MNWLPLMAQDDSSIGSIFFWSFLLLVLVIGLFVVVTILHKKMSPNEDFHGEGFSLSDLRQLHKKGQMSDEEFQRAKIALLGSLSKTPENKMPAKATPNLETKDLTPPF